MNDIQKTEMNEQLVRVLGVIGFVVLVCLLAWLAVQLVRLIPVAFDSLAKVFENNQERYEERTHEDDDENVVIVDNNDNNGPVTGSDNKPVATSTTPVVSNPRPATSTPVATTPKPTTPAPVSYHTVTTYQVPVSDPNGKTDLQVTFVGVGNINSSGRFNQTNSINEGDKGAMQFTVKNIGTKTSSAWTFEALLPNGSTFASTAQVALKPSESSTLTLVFGTEDLDSSERIGATVSGGGDVNPSNNSFSIMASVR